VIDEEGRKAEVSRDALGDVEAFELADQKWTLERDSAGRVETIEDGGGRAWEYERDGAGRLQRWIRRNDFRLEWFPIDDTAASRDAVLADAHDVVVSDGLPEGGQPSGSTLLRLRLADGTTALELQDRRSVGGDVEEFEGAWRPDLLGTSGDDVDVDASEETEASLGGVLSESLSPPSIEGDSSNNELDPIGAAIAEAKEDRGFALSWGSVQVQPLEGDGFLPSAFGRGVGISSSGWQRIPALAGGTVTWLGDGAEANGLRVPTSGGEWRSPEGWLAFPAPPATLDPPVYGPPTPAANPGAARAVQLWWKGLGLDADSLTRLPPGVSSGGPPSIDPREFRQARGSLLPEGASTTGAGVVLPAVPGASRLLPGPLGLEQLGVGELLVLSGDLPSTALDHRRQLASSADAWQMEVPGADLLRVLLSRRLQPSLPPGWTGERIRGFSPALDGLQSSSRGVSSRSAWTPRPVASGLPPGLRDVLPGVCRDLPGALGSLPSDGRCSALEELSDNPLVPGASERRVAEDDAMLIFLSAMEREPVGEMGGFLSLGLPLESWRISTPSGVQIEVDGRGRLLSIAVHSRQRRGWAREAAALAGIATLHPSSVDLRELQALLAPRYLPMPDVLPEALWGLLPSSPSLPIGSLGEPLLPELRYLAPLSPLPAEPWKRPTAVPH